MPISSVSFLGRAGVDGSGFGTGVTLGADLPAGGALISVGLQASGLTTFVAGFPPHIRWQFFPTGLPSGSVITGAYFDLYAVEGLAGSSVLDTASGSGLSGSVDSTSATHQHLYFTGLLARDPLDGNPGAHAGSMPSVLITGTASWVPEAEQVFTHVNPPIATPQQQVAYQTAYTIGLVGTQGTYTVTGNASGHNNEEFAIAAWIAALPGDPEDDEEEEDDDEGGRWNLHDQLGRYYVADGVTGQRIAFYGSHHSTPPFAVESTVVSGPAYKRPVFVKEPRGRIRLVYEEVDVGVYEKVSDDEGATWESAVSVFSGGKHGTLAQDPLTGTIVYAARVGVQLKGRIQYPGDSTPGAEFVMQYSNGGTLTDIQSEGAFRISAAPDGPRRWLLLVKRDNGLKHYQSWDEARTWSEIV